MKKKWYLIIALSIIAIILGIFYLWDSRINISEIKLIKLANSMPDKYTYEDAVKNSEIINISGKVTNLNKLEDFITNIKNCKSSTIRIISYTIEGDPIVEILMYDGKVIKYLYDDSRDKFGASNKGIFITQAMNIEKGESLIYLDETVTKPVINYYLVGGLDGNEKRTILYIDK